MPPKRKRDDVDVEVDEQREAFRNRGDLSMYRLGTKADLALTVGGQRLLLHKSFLISRVGKYRRLLTGRDELPKDHRGRTAYTEQWHDADAVGLVVEFVYGDWKVETLEYQSENQAVIQDCIELYNLGHDFDIPRMVQYALKHLGKHLSSKLKDICIYPLAKALEAAGRKEFLDDLEAGINQAEIARAGATVLAQLNHPRLMLIDFVVVAGDVLLRESRFRFSVGEDVLPPAFINAVFLAERDTKYQTQWMRKLKAPPAKLLKPQPNRRGSCASCGGGVHKDQKALFNPWSHQRFAQKYTQICCEGCAKEMEDSSDDEGVVWDVFDDVKEE